MENNWELNQWKKLLSETAFYHKLFQKMAIKWDFSHGYTWSLGWRGDARQIYINSGNSKNITPIELGIIGIWLSLWSEESIESRIETQTYLMRLWIVNNDNIVDHAYEMIKLAKPEHMCKGHFIQNHTENAAKIVILRRAYEALDYQRQWWQLKDSEDRIILWYVMALLWDRYKMRPYMLDPELKDESWVTIYDHLFHNFSEESRKKYETDWYADIWRSFLAVRNSIAQKKRNKILIEEGRERTNSILNTIIQWNSH